jgi:outer membrane immunogenic protein
VVDGACSRNALLPDCHNLSDSQVTEIPTLPAARAILLIYSDTFGLGGVQMKKLLIAAIAAATFCATSALAADLPTKAPAIAAPVPMLNWTGFYIGIEGGGAWGTSRHDFPGGFGTHSPFDVSGGLFGGTVGYNWQAGNFLLGLEGDLSWASSKGSTVGVTPCTGGPCTSNLTWLGTARGRAGYVFGMWMPYVTGGLASGNLDTCENLTCSSDTHTGWTIGGGIEARFMGNWSAKAEYLYADLGSHNAYFFIAQHTATLTENIVRFGLNYKF